MMAIRYRPDIEFARVTGKEKEREIEGEVSRYRAEESGTECMTRYFEVT